MPILQITRPYSSKEITNKWKNYSFLSSTFASLIKRGSPGRLTRVAHSYKPALKIRDGHVYNFCGALFAFLLMWFSTFKISYVFVYLPFACNGSDKNSKKPELINARWFKLIVLSSKPRSLRKKNKLSLCGLTDLYLGTNCRYLNLFLSIFCRSF